MNSPLDDQTPNTSSLSASEAATDCFRAAVVPEELFEQIVAVIRKIFDPEVPVSIYDMGLIYGVDIAENGNVVVKMTLTTPSCPTAQTLPEQVRVAVAQVPGVVSAKVDIVWDPPWTPERMSDAAKLQLGVF